MGESTSDLATTPLANRRVLVVDDEHLVAKSMRQLLSSLGCVAVSHTSPAEAIAAAQESDFEAILADVNMPDMSGLEMLQELRSRGVDSPAVLMTAVPSVQSAASALALGVVHYLVKPFNPSDLQDAVVRAVNEYARLKRQKKAIAYYADGEKQAEAAQSEAEQLAQAMDLMYLANQPIVGWLRRRIIGYEALLRSDAPDLNQPGLILAAAERQGCMNGLARMIRREAAETVPRLPPGTRLFVNLHPQDLFDPQLLDPSAPLSQKADKVVLEITERASLTADMATMRPLLEGIQELGFQLAVDDLGAGYSSLSLLAELHPDIAKIDMSLVRGIDRDEAKVAVVRSIIELCDKLDVEVIAEGIETLSECLKVVELGCDQLQGFLFAKPTRGMPTRHFGLPDL